ncbi:MAG: restriction endonuclease subunit S [Candidatus Nanopelagicales bacterium]
MNTTPAGWTRKPLSDFIQLKRGFDLPYRKRQAGPYRVLSSGESSGWHDEGPVKGPGFVVGRATNIGRPTWSDADYWPLNTVLYAADFIGNDPKFAYFWFLATDLTAYNSGSVQPMLNRNYIANVVVDVPPNLEQQAIAATLGALDDKIESNRRTSALLLELAEAVYLQACSRGADTIQLRDAGRWLSGGTPSTERGDYWGGDLPWISAASLKGFYVSSSDRCLTETGADVATNIVPRGAVLMVVRGMSLKTEFRFGVAQRDVAFGQDCKAILPTIPSSVLAMALRASSKAILDLVDEAGHGTGRLATDLLEQRRIAVPRERAIADALDELIARGAFAEQESVRLTALRDTLLPGLLSGRIRVSEAADAMSSAATHGGSA